VDYSDKSREELLEEIKFLKNKEKNISLVLGNINEIFFHLSFDENDVKHFEYLSPHVDKVLGLSTEEYKEANNNNKILEYFHPDDVEKLIKESKKITPEQKEYAFTYRFFNKKIDKYVWIEETIVATYKKNGKKSAIFGTAKDITEKIGREHQLSFILENIDECIYNVKFTPTGKVLSFVSPQIDEITGLTIDEFHKEGQSGKLIERIHPDDIDIINKNIDKALYKEKKKQIKSVFRLKPKNGKKYLWIEETLHAIYDKKGDLLETTTVLRDITYKKTAELHLKENEEKYRTLFTKNLAGVFITENNVIIDCNNSFAKIFGYKSRVELIGKNVTSLYFSKKDREKYIKDLKKKGYLTNYRIRHKSKKNEEIWILTNVSLKEKGRIEGTLVDITEQVDTEQKLKESRESYKKLVDNSPYGTIIHVDGEIFYANPKALDLFGIKSLDDLKEKRNIFDFLPKKYHKEGLDIRKKVLKGGDSPFVEVSINKPLTGKKMILETKATKYDYQGKEAIQVFFKDVTLEKELSKEKLRATIAEESNKILQKEIIERRKIEKKLIENQKYTNSIINSSLDIICASDEKGRIIEFNSAAEQAFGYKEEEVKQKGVKIIYATKQEYIDVSKQLKKTGVFVGEVKNKRKNGEIFTSFLSASVLQNEEGEQIGTMGVSRDITELKEAEQQLIESEEKYRDLFENATDLIQSLDMKGNIVYVNDSWKKVLGYTDKELQNKNIFELIHPDCSNKCEKLFRDFNKRKGEETKKALFDLKTKKGKKITVEGNISLKIKDGKPVSTRAILRDITEELWDKTLQNVYNNVAKIVTEKANPDDIYEGIRKELGKVINTNIFAISYVLEENKISFPYYYDETRKGAITVKTRQQKKGLNEYLIKLGESKILYKEDLKQLIKKGEYKKYGPSAAVFIGVPLKIKNKVIGIVSVQSYNNKSALDEKALQALEFISGALALTVQRKQDESVIFKQSSRLKSIIENSTHLFWTYDQKKGLTSFNKNFINYIGEAYNKKAEIKKKNEKKLRFAPKEFHSFWDDKYGKAYKGKAQYFISKKQNSEGKEIVKEVFLNPIYDNDGKVLEISGIAHDITEKTLSEQKLKESLQEKEVLLKEVHHRVKNNLQVISSILNLQSSYVKDEKTLTILKESQNRIKSMSFIHESLYQTNDFSKINFSEYIGSLSKNLVHSYGIYDDLVELELLTENVFLNLDLSIPCGLIINELVSNALKYAFTDKKKGIINIQLFIKDEDVCLKIKDNGVGLPKGIDYKNTETLGLQLVTSLIEQINGTIELKQKQGTEYIITFKQHQ
jgi:PAS domain S-box-containing protein